MGQLRNSLMNSLGKSRAFLALLGFGASAVYLALGQHQLPGYFVVTGGFLVCTAFQLILALVTLFAPSERIFTFGWVGNFILLLIGIGSHILGLPFTAHPMTPQILGSGEFCIYIMELLEVLFYFRRTRSTTTEKQSGVLRIALVSILSLLLTFGLTSLGVTSVFADYPDAMNMSAPVPPGQQGVSVT